MSDIREAIAAGVKACLKHRITGVYPTTSEEEVQDIVLAFLRKMPDVTRTEAPSRAVGFYDHHWYPSDLADAIERNRAPGTGGV